MTDSAGRRFKPTFWATVCAVPAFLMLAGLGTWQFQRLDWKTDLIAERQARSQGPAVALPGGIEDPAVLEFTLVEVTGTFLHDREMHLGARTRRGNVGFDVVTPLRLEDGRGLLVDRGWVPPERRDPESRPLGQIEGSVTLQGLVRTGGWKGYDFVRPENDPEENLYFWLDLPVMTARAGLEDPVTEIYVAAGPEPNPGGFPIGGQTRIEIPNDHLQYAITWYALALALAVIYFLFHYRPGHEAGGPGARND
jgi:surfeit locus 1 family protein